MSDFLSDGDKLKCMFGSSSAALKVGKDSVQGESKGVANILDAIPVSNIPSFGTCKITKCPCVPMTVCWISSLKVHVRGLPALDKDAKTFCALGGLIQPDGKE